MFECYEKTVINEYKERSGDLPKSVGNERVAVLLCPFQNVPVMALLRTNTDNEAHSQDSVAGDAV